MVKKSCYDIVDNNDLLTSSWPIHSYSWTLQFNQEVFMRKDTQQERQWAVHRFFDGESPDALRLSRTLSVMALQVGGALSAG